MASIGQRLTLLESNAAASLRRLATVELRLLESEKQRITLEVRFNSLKTTLVEMLELGCFNWSGVDEIRERIKAT